LTTRHRFATFEPTIYSFLKPKTPNPMKRLITLPALLAGLVPALSLAALAIPHTAAADCAALPSSLGTASLTLNVESAGTYIVWVRQLAPAADSGGFYLQVPDAGACQITMGNAAIPANAWTWVNYQNGDTGSKVSVNLSAGNHAVTLSGLKSGVEVDRLLLLSDANCTPSGDGSNCAAAAATSVTPTPSGAATTSTGAGGQGVPGSPNAAILKSSSPASSFFAAAGRFRGPLLLAGLLIIAIPALWFLALHLGLIHPAQHPAGLDLPGQPKSPASPEDEPTALPIKSVKPQDQPKLPQLPDTPPPPTPGSTTAPAPEDPPGAPPTKAK
jgi:hypothetical protein